MAPPPSTRRKSSRRHKGHRSSSTLSRIGRICRDWWAEILVAVLALLAVFLLVEQMDIRQTLFSWLQSGVGNLEALLANLGQRLARFARNTSLSDMVAYLLLVAVVVLIGWRTRYRLLTTPRLSELRCPRCGGDLHRIHRRWCHRVLNLFLPVRRYRCADRSCGWRGLRIRQRDH